MNTPLNLPEQPDLSRVFAPCSLSLWREAAEAQLKGADFEKTLYTRTLEGLTLHPLYTAADLAGQALQDGRRGWRSTPGWQISQEMRHGENVDLAHERAQGLDALELNGDELSWETLQTLLPTDLPLWLTSSRPHSLWQRLTPFGGGMLCDPIGDWISGQSDDPDAAFAEVAALTQATPPALAVLQISGRRWHEAGAHAAQELAYTLAGLVDSLQALRAHGLSPAHLLARTRLELAAGPAFLMELAKFRALRVLVSRVAEIYGCSPAGLRVHARTAQLTLTHYDPYTNLLRQSLGALAAVLGGTDSLCTGGFSEASGLPDAFARRQARTLQLVLRHEVHLDRLIDPAGGSFALESLTSELAQAAWNLFQEIEAAGGLREALQQGAPQAAVAVVAAQRRQRVHQRKTVLVGTNHYPNPDDTAEAVHVHAPWPVPPEHLPDGLVRLQPLRLASELEDLRRHLSGRGVRALLLPLVHGETSLHALRPRLGFCQGVCEVGGLQVQVPPEAFHSSADALETVSNQAPDVVVLCSSDADSLHWVSELVPTLRQAHPLLKIWVAGKPGAHEASWRADGVDDFVFLGGDVYGLLSSL